MDRLGPKSGPACNFAYRVHFKAYNSVIFFIRYNIQNQSVGVFWQFEPGDKF